MCVYEKNKKQKGHVDTLRFFQFYMCIFLWLQKHQVSTFYPGHWAGGTRACDVANTQILLAFKKKKKTWCDVLWHVFAFSRELSRKTSKDRQAASDYRKFHLKAFIVRWRAVNVHPSSQHFNDQSIPPLPQFQHWFQIMQSCEITLSWWLVLKWFFSTPRGLASFIPQRNNDDVSDSRQCRSWADWHLLREKVSPPTLHDFPGG